MLSYPIVPVRRPKRPFGEGILVTTSTASELWHTLFILLPCPFHSNSLLAYLNTNTVSESKFPGVNKHITIQGRQQNAAETIWKLINVNRRNLRRKLDVNEAAVAETNDWRTAALRLQSQNQITVMVSAVLDAARRKLSSDATDGWCSNDKCSTPAVSRRCSADPRDQFPGDPLIHYCNGDLDVHVCLNKMHNLMFMGPCIIFIVE